jgi:probable phosphoglycerate mutase
MATLLLIRHGETDWNAEHRWQGHADVPLNARGRDQAKALAEELAPEGVDAIYASDLSRARDTAEIVGERLGVPVVLDPDLREIDVGSWDGEPHERHGERILRAVRTIAERHPGERVAVVSHGGSLRRMQEHLGGELDAWFANCCVWALSHRAGAFSPID